MLLLLEVTVDKVVSDKASLLVLLLVEELVIQGDEGAVTVGVVLVVRMGEGTVGLDGVGAVWAVEIFTPQTVVTIESAPTEPSLPPTHSL